MKRNRIVIPFYHSQAGAVPGKARRRKGLGRVLLVVAVILLVVVGGLAVGGYLWWNNFQKSPAYSLAILADASQRNDTTAIESVMDIDKVTDDFVAQARQHSTGLAASAVDSVWPTGADSVLTSLTPKLKQTVHDELLNELKRLTAPGAGKPFILVALGIRGLAEIKEENKIAQAGLNIKDEHLQLTMQPSETPGRWRITAVKDDKLTTLVVDSMKKQVPSAGAGIQDEIRKQVDKFKKR
jgi:hypothetical protein